VHGYEAGRIDIVQILLEARGFADLLERADFLQRVRDQDVRIFTAVKRARAAVTQIGPGTAPPVPQPGPPPSAPPKSDG